MRQRWETGSGSGQGCNAVQRGRALSGFIRPGSNTLQSLVAHFKGFFLQLPAGWTREGCGGYRAAALATEQGQPQAVAVRLGATQWRCPIGFRRKRSLFSFWKSYSAILIIIVITAAMMKPPDMFRLARPCKPTVKGFRTYGQIRFLPRCVRRRRLVRVSISDSAWRYCGRTSEVVWVTASSLPPAVLSLN